MSIITNKDFFAGLDMHDQAVFSQAAAEAALTERTTSVADIPNILAECEAQGVEVVRMDDKELVKFQEVVGQVYDMYADYFQAGLVESIQKA